MNPKHGELWLADLGLAAKTRPVVIVSRDEADPPRRLYVYVPLTTQNRGSSYEVALSRYPTLRTESVVNVQGIGSLPAPRFLRKLGVLNAEDMERVQQALRLLLTL